MDSQSNTQGQRDLACSFAGSSQQTASLSRRHCLKMLSTGGLAIASQSAFAGTGLSTLQAIASGKASNSESEKTLAELDRTISLYNTHTRETLLVTFFSNGMYNENELNRLNLFLRDHRENEVMMMDRHLFTQMWAIRSLLDTDATFEIVSGYRTPKTNEYLRGKSSGVARFSYHMLGRAIDLRLREVPTAAVRDTARQLNAGGVGYYQSSDFVHIDTGEIRHWG